MIKNQEEDEFIAVRVQDPRLQSEGSWNSYVDFKIFLHTNSKAFTAKTSCVRRRFSEFVWLKKKLQKNSGLVPVPDLPSKSFFSFNNQDFLERRRKGLQCFLDKVLHMTVCLSDSQLHLFLQTQLPLGHIQDCVQGHTPYTVTEAILTYASSNRGWAQEEDAVQEWTLTAVSYESMESPAPHMPTLPSAEPLTPASPTSTDPEAVQTLECIADIHDMDTVELQINETENPSLAATQEDSRAEAVLEIRSPAEAASAGDGQGELAPDEETHQEGRQQQTPVERHRPEGAEEESVVVVERALEEESPADGAEETIPHAEVVPEPSSREETCHGDTLEKPVPDPVSHVEPTREDNRPGATGSVGDANEAGRRDDGQGRVDETEGREEDDDAETVLEVENGDGATREKEKTLREGSEAEDGEEEEEEDEEMLPGGVFSQNEDPDGESSGETSSDGSSLEESATEDAGPEKTSQVTNGYMETTPEERRQNTDEADAEVRDTDGLKSKTSQDPSLDDGSAEADDVREIVCVEVGENEEILYMSNICPAKTVEETSSGVVEGVEEMNIPEIRDGNHLESSDNHCTDDISLSVVPDTEAPVKCREREVHEFTADASLTLSRETEP